MHNVNQSIRGFTLVELLVVVSILGILAAIIAPSITGTRTAANDQVAIGKAQAINQAKQIYQYRVTTPTWTGTSSTDYAALQPYIPYAPGTLAAYTPSGYSFNLGATLSTAVVITGPSGTVSY